MRQEIIVKTLREHGPMTESELLRFHGLTIYQQGSISQQLHRLAKYDIIRHDDGRPRKWSVVD